ncbi:hypothetical protein MP638_006638 [Amoeboaphelidium occidentale]|nr:hypothetical protein MP638_006638 [Amoeboaphelidium occidentale]
MSFLFGNLNAKGEVENEELKDLANNEYLQNVLMGFGGSILKEESKEQGEGGSSSSRAAAAAAVVKPLENAVDFSNISDGEEDDAMDVVKEPVVSSAPAVPKPVVVAPLPAPPQAKPQKEVQPSLEQIQSLLNSNCLKFTQLLVPNSAAIQSSSASFPSKGAGAKLNKLIQKKKDLQLFKLQSKIPLSYQSTEENFNSASSSINAILPGAKPVESTTDEAESKVQVSSKEQKSEVKEEQVFNDRMFHPVELCAWEDDIIYDYDSIQKFSEYKKKRKRLEFDVVPDYDLIIGDWESKIIYDESDVPKNMSSSMLSYEVEIPMNDPYLHIEYNTEQNNTNDALKRFPAYPAHFYKVNKSVSITSHASALFASQLHTSYAKEAKKRPVSGNAKDDVYFTSLIIQPLVARSGQEVDNTQNNEGDQDEFGTGKGKQDKKKEQELDEFNISNDRYYEMHRQKTGRVRQLFGKIAPIQHLLPALRLSLPYYRRFMSKAELRAWHRPPIQLQNGEVMKFQRVKNQLKKTVQQMQLKKVTMHDLVQNVTDITLADNGNYILIEYSEEYPPLIQNVGMETLFINYYRKKDDKDASMPVSEGVGMPVILEQVDASPFFGFGDCLPGETVTAFKNNLFVVPIFKQQLNNEDFLLIRRRLKPGHYVHYIREIGKIYVAGQTYPLQEVSPPQSRKVKAYVKDRLIVAAMRRFKRKGRTARYPINKIVNTYHRYHEQSMRKHLKDVFDLQKNSKNKHFVVLKKDVMIPSEQELLKMVTPEMVCLFESTRVGQQRLADAGFGYSEMMDEDGNEEESKLDDEIQLAPWNVTKNFILACQNKGMVKLYGSGDPTGCGEGFSFFRASMKLMFLREGMSVEEEQAYFESQVKTGHKFALADQRKFYQQEINRIWNAQVSSLTSTDPHEDWDNEIPLKKALASRASMHLDDDISESEAADYKSMLQMINSPGPKSQHGSQHGDFETASVTSSTTMQADKRKIKRALLLKRQLKDGNTQEELVMDPNVIQAYQRKKLLIKVTAGGKHEIHIDDDDQTIKEKGSAAIRSQRRIHGAIKFKDQPQRLKQKDGTVRYGNAKRKCTSCGQVGHIATNYICPNFKYNYPEKYKKKSVSMVHTKGSKIIVPKLAIEHVEETRKKNMTVKIKLASAKEEDGKLGDNTEQVAGEQAAAESAEKQDPVDVTTEEPPTSGPPSDKDMPQQ